MISSFFTIPFLSSPDAALLLSSRLAKEWFGCLVDGETLIAYIIAVVLQVCVILCLVMSIMLLAEVVFMSAVSFAVKFLGRWLGPRKRYKCDPLDGDVENATLLYPMVLIQIPMYNELEVYKLSIRAACCLCWPSDRIIVQVLDDSVDPTIKDLVQLECKLWKSKGVNVKYECRDNRLGYKAGALKRGMEHSYVHQCDFVAIFDADFQPESDFLMRTIPFLVHNPKLALVQARWNFMNFRECLMTRIQKMTLDYHFKVEQEAGSSTFAFFGFNGTAGVWRISAINEAGGWKDRTTVEDMDLAVRATLNGWKLLYVGDVKVNSELPSTLKAYRYQQHRWTCGASNLFKKMAVEILTAKEVSVWKKFYVIYSFFFVRKIVAHIVTFTFYCIVVPLSVFIPAVNIPVWAVVHVPTTITVLNAIRNPSSIHLVPLWILFENVMSMHRMKATLVGLFGAESVNEWVVTEKLGESLKDKLENHILEQEPVKIRGRVNFAELGFAIFLFFSAWYDLAHGKDYYYIFIFLQAIAFLVVGCGYVGTIIPNS